MFIKVLVRSGKYGSSRAFAKPFLLHIYFYSFWMWEPRKWAPRVCELRTGWWAREVAGEKIVWRMGAWEVSAWHSSVWNISALPMSWWKIMAEWCTTVLMIGRPQLGRPYEERGPNAEPHLRFSSTKSNTILVRSAPHGRWVQHFQPISA